MLRLFLMLTTASVGLLLCLNCSITRADLVFSGPSETTHPIDPAIAANDSRFQEWANAIDSTRTNFGPRGSTTIDQTGGFNSLGDLDATQIANGVSPGFLTVTFPTGIRNGSGHDFAVFENGFTFGTNAIGVPGLFAEFAFVDVSTNGSDFARFQGISRNTAPLIVSGAFAGYDVTQVYNLAGKHASGFGTPFDLSELELNPMVLNGLLDLNNVQFVRLFDIPGNGSFLDSLGNPILDNWLTSGSGGFDFRIGIGRGIGVMNVATVPEPSSLMLIGIIATGASWWRKRKRTQLCRSVP